MRSSESKNIDHSYLDQFSEGELKRLTVFGLASPDGDELHNDDLSQLRAANVQTMIQQELETKDTKIDTEHWGLGEVHLTQGIANSRSVRVVACIKVNSATVGGLNGGSIPVELDTNH